MARAARAEDAGTSPESARRSSRALVIATLGFFLITLDILIVNVALTRIGLELGGGTAAQQWVIDGYTLVFATLLLLAGNLADRFGARRTIGIGIAGFTVTSLACAVAPTMAGLIAARCAQGAAAALMLPASMALIREAFPDVGRRARALGVWAVGGAVATAAGPLLGGLLTTIDWRWVFWLNLPVGATMLVLLPGVSRSVAHPAPFDWAAQVLGSIALAALVFGLIHGGAVGFGTGEVVAALALAVAAAIGFVVVERRVAHPMLPLDLLGGHGMRVAMTAGFTFMVGWYGTVFLVSLYLQQERGLSPLAAGLAFLPSAIVSIFGNLGSGLLTQRFGARFPAMAGQLSMAVGLAALTLTAGTGSPALIAALVVLIGGGGSIAMPQITGLVLAGVPPERAGIASGIFNTFRQVGGAVAIAVFGALVAAPSGFLPGMRVSLGLAAAALLVTGLSFLTLRRDPRVA
jgi:DHA2 family methylenomycin A resistance protein-like MFS transporter